MPAERRSLYDILAPIIYWDATFAIAGLEERESFHAECDAFARRLESESVLSVTSDFVYNELAFYKIKSALIDEGNRTGQHWLDVKRHDPTFIATVMPDVEVKKAELERVTLKISISDTVMEQAFRLMHTYSLLPTDAFHIAIALDAGIHSFASLDADFLRVDDIVVYTCVP